MATASPISYRIMTPADIAGGLSLCRVVGWNQLSRDWELFLKLSPGTCRVAIDSSGSVIGTVTTIRYENQFSWIGMLLVDPAWQGKGIGKNLLDQALQMLPADQTVKLDATPAGQEVYLKYNFVEEYPISRMMLSASPSQTMIGGAAMTNPTDFEEILGLDAEVFGSTRKMALKWMWRSGQQFSFVARNGRNLEGYCFGRIGHLYAHIGPVIAHHEGVAQQLVSSVLNTVADRPIIVDVPSHKPHWISWLQLMGFREQRTLTRMFKGTNSHPGIPEKQFAILGPEFG